jgi:hypothetical protein
MTRHFEFLVEEPSMEAFLNELLPRLLPEGCTFQIHTFQGKQDLLGKLESRLRGYSSWLPPDWRIVVVVDLDDEDCRQLKNRMEQIATKVGLRTRSQSPSGWQIVNRIAIEELEAWYFGDWDAVVTAYPRVSPNVPRKRKYRNPDGIRNAREALEQLFQRHGYFQGGLPKIAVARTLGQHLDPRRCRSQSFICLRDAILEAVHGSSPLP